MTSLWWLVLRQASNILLLLCIFVFLCFQDGTIFLDELYIRMHTGLEPDASVVILKDSAGHCCCRIYLYQSAGFIIPENVARISVVSGELVNTMLCDLFHTCCMHACSFQSDHHKLLQRDLDTLNPTSFRPSSHARSDRDLSTAL